MAIDLALIVILGVLSRYILEYKNISATVGFLIIGIIIGPEILNLLKPEFNVISYEVRTMALIVILLRAGLELQRKRISKIKLITILYSFIPIILEISSITIFAPMIFNITYYEAFVTGLILGAVSPAIIVPLMIEYVQLKKGIEKHIPFLVIGSSSISNILIIVVFGIVVTWYNGSQNIDISLFNLIEIPQSIILGLILGIIAGFIIHFITSKIKIRATYITLVILAICIYLIWIEKEIKPYIVFSAMMAIITIGFILTEMNINIANKISMKLSKIWIFIEIVLFIMIGSQLSLEIIYDAGLKVLALVTIGLVFRTIGVIFSLIKSQFDVKERIFLITSYLPKATVQIAIGAIPLELGFKSGELILSIAILSVIITAPIGSILVKFVGKKWIN